MDGWNDLSLKFPDKSGLGGKHIKNLQMWTDQTCEDWSSSGGRTGNILTRHRLSNFLHWTESYHFRIDQYVPNAINTWHIFSHTCKFPRLCDGSYHIWVISPSHSKNMLVLVKITILQPLSFLSSSKNFMKIFVLIIRVCKHSDIKFESRKQFCKYV